MYQKAKKLGFIPSFSVLSTLFFLSFSISVYAQNSVVDAKDSKSSQTIRVFALNHDIESQGIGEQIGTIEFSNSPDGLVIWTQLDSLGTGEHGFHIHQNPSCEFKTIDNYTVPGLSAGGHFDPEHAGKHLGPDGTGHLGDLPKIIADDAGHSQQTLMASRLNLQLIQGRSIIIHESGDNYSDMPNKLGGGGARVACGVISE